MAAFAAVFSLCANAQDWKGNTVADGTFYLYNIGSGQWLCGGNNWGTRASVNSTGDIDFQIAASGTGYTLDSQISNGGENHFLAPVDANAAYVDSGAYEWTFTQASRSDGVIAYIISCDHGNLFFSGEGTIVNVDTENGVGDNAQWVLVSLDDRMAKLQAASEANPVNATFLIKDAGFGRNDLRVSAWTMEANNQNLDGRGKPNNFNCAESWQSAFTLTQNVTVPNGKYQVTAQAALTDYTDAYDGADYPVVYANEASAPFKNMEGNDIGSNMETLSNSFLTGKYTVGPLEIAVVDGNITLGVRGTRTNTWCIWDNFQIFYLGEVQDFSAALQAAIDNVESFYGKLPAAVETEVKSFVDTQKANATNNDATQAAISALNAKANELVSISKAFANAKNMADNVYKSKYYDAVKALAEVKEYKEFTEGAHAKLEASVYGFGIPIVDINVVNTLTTAEAINEYVAQIDEEARNHDEALRQAGIEYNNNAAPVGDAKFNLTFLLVNANLEGLPIWQKCDGWFTDRTDGNAQVMVNERVASEDGTKTAFFEYWSNDAANDGVFTAYQKVLLPASKYDVSCYAYANPDNVADATESNVKLFANDTEGQLISSTILAPASISFELTEAGDVKIGLKALEGNTMRWMGIGYVELFRNGITEEPAPEFKLAFNPESGTEVAVDDEIAFEFDSDNFQLWITTDGSDPTTSETAMNLFPNETVKVAGEGEFVVKAVLEDNKTNLKSEVFTATYPIKAVAPFELTFNPESGTEVAVDDEIAFEFDSDNFQLWVTTDGTDPTTSLTAMNLFPNETVKVAGEGEFVVKAVLENNKTNQKSEVFTATYPIKAAVKDIVLTDDDTEAPAPGEYETITYDRKFLKGYNTIVLPFDYTNLELGADVVMKYDGTKDNHVQLIRLKDDEVMKANVPYVVFVRTDKKIAGFDKNKTVVEPDDLTVPGGEFDFVGSYKAYAKGESPVKRGDYIFRSDLQKAKGGNEHKAYRGYLKSTTGVETANLYIVVDGELDGISTIENAQKADGYIYNLNGQRVNDTKKGIFIINGKKVVKK